MNADFREGSVERKLEWNRVHLAIFSPATKASKTLVGDVRVLKHNM